MTVRVQQERDDGAPSILTELPRRTYPAGVVEAVADPPGPGRYRLPRLRLQQRSTDPWKPTKRST